MFSFFLSLFRILLLCCAAYGYMYVCAPPIRAVYTPKSILIIISAVISCYREYILYQKARDNVDDAPSATIRTPSNNPNNPDNPDNKSNSKHNNTQEQSSKDLIENVDILQLTPIHPATATLDSPNKSVDDSSIQSNISHKEEENNPNSPNSPNSPITGVKIRETEGLENDNNLEIIINSKHDSEEQILVEPGPLYTDNSKISYYIFTVTTGALTGFLSVVTGSSGPVVLMPILMLAHWDIRLCLGNNHFILTLITLYDNPSNP